MSDLDPHYDNFGKSIKDAVRVEINRQGDLSALLGRLGEPTPPQLEQQHEVLASFITRYGPLFFMSIVKSDWPAEQVQRMKENLKHGVDTPIPSPERRPAAHVTTEPAPSSHEDGENGNTNHAFKGKRILPNYPRPIRQPRSPYSALTREEMEHSTSASDGHHDSHHKPLKEAPGVSSPAQKSNVPWIITPNYQGPDRRENGDRRQSQSDRRTKLQVVFKNNRFGGKDRRKTVRRASDRKNSTG